MQELSNTEFIMVHGLNEGYITSMLCKKSKDKIL